MNGEAHPLISAQDHEQISNAIRLAETRTSGEIYAVVAKASDDYFYVAGFMAAIWTMLMALIGALALWWMERTVSPATIMLAQAVGLALFLCLFAIVPNLRLLFVPRTIAHRRSAHNALRQFLAHGVHATQGRSGVLIFVSLAEHHVEVIADAGINEKVSQEDWDDIVAILIDHAANRKLGQGYRLAIEKAGHLLATHFPPEDKPQNELDDRLVEI